MAHLTKKNEHAFRDLIIPTLPAVPTLTTADEQAYLYWLAKEQYQGKGALIEIGTWFGSSAGYLAAGLRDAEKTEPLYCYDWFMLRPGEQNAAIEQGFTTGDVPLFGDTRPLVEQYLKDIYPSIVLTKTDIADFSWDKGPIELLHLDAPKRLQEIVHVLTVIQQFLLPGESYILAQDFCVPRAYALPLIFGALQTSWSLVQVPTHNGTMAVFRYDNPYEISDRLRIDEWPVEFAHMMMSSFLHHFSHDQQNALRVGFDLYMHRRTQKDVE